MSEQSTVGMELWGPLCQLYSEWTKLRRFTYLVKKRNRIFASTNLHLHAPTRSYTDWMDALSNNNNRGSYLHSEIPLWNCYYYVVCTIWFSVVWMPCSISKFVKGWMVKVCCFGLLLAEKEREREHVSFFLHVYIHFPLKTAIAATATTTRKKSIELTTIRYVCASVGFFPLLLFTHSNFFGCFNFLFCFLFFCFGCFIFVSA